MLKPPVITDKKYRYDSFGDGKMLPEKKPGRLPVMGWNSWNAFGSANTEELTMAQAEKLSELGLKDLGYEYVVLDDGCYVPERVDGRLACETIKFPSGFKGIADKLHAMGLKFGMYNDVGEKLCSGAEVGTCGHERDDAASYAGWDIDFIKVDNCYYPWDNATFSAAENARYSWAPNIKSVRVEGGDFSVTLSAAMEGMIIGDVARVCDCRESIKGDTGEKKCDLPTDAGACDTCPAKDVGAYVTCIGTKDGTGPYESPLGTLGSELVFLVNAPKAGDYAVSVLYATGKEEGVGEWLQIGVDSEVYYDDLLPETEGKESFVWSEKITVKLEEGVNRLRIMNHRRRENAHKSYATFIEALREAVGDRDVVLSVCEWGKNQPHTWAYRMGDYWRILNDITFSVGSDGTPGQAAWSGDYTNNITAQYNKAVIMDSFAGLNRGWNDPDMMVVGLDGIDETMNRTHFTMWCMMNSPLFLGMDLRKVEKGDFVYKIISNKEVIALNQDPLGIQAKRVYTTYKGIGSGLGIGIDGNDLQPDTLYIVDNDRVDVLAKPLADGSIAVSFFNLSDRDYGELSVSFEDVAEKLGETAERFMSAKAYRARDLWTGEEVSFDKGFVSVPGIAAHADITYRIVPV